MTLPASADMKLLSLKTLLNTYITDYIEKNIEKFYQSMHILTQIVFVNIKKIGQPKLFIFFQKHTGILKLK